MLNFVIFPLITLLGVLATVLMWFKIFGLDGWVIASGFGPEVWIGGYTLWTLGSGLICWYMSRDLASFSTDMLLLEDSDHEHPLAVQVSALCKRFGFQKPGELAIYGSSEANIFAAGLTPARSVLCVSKGFLNLRPDQQEVLIAAELQKLNSGLSSLLIFCQGMTHGLVLYFSRMLAFLLGTSYRQADGSSSSVYPEKVLNGLTTIFLTLWGSLAVSLLSRIRHRAGDRFLRDAMGPEALTLELQTLRDTVGGLQSFDVFTEYLKANNRHRLPLGPLASHPALAKRSIT